jgi:Transposase DDE domain
MNKCINLYDFLNNLFDQEQLIKKAMIIIQGVLEACSPRLARIAEKMPGRADANYKIIQRFLAQVDLKAALLRFFQEEAEFVIGDPTEMKRPQAKKTPYVGQLSDGQTLGYWLLVLATPFRGRAIPFHFITYSSKTIGAQATSRNQEHFRAFAQIKALLGERPLVLDREFSYLELLQNLVLERIHFVIHLKIGLPQVSLLNNQGQPVKLIAKPNQTVIYPQLWYKGLVQVNVIGLWREGFQSPLWVMTDLEAEKGLQIYLQRMKIEQSFRDCKNLLGLEQAMNKQQAQLEQMIALTLLAYIVGLFLGEALRDVTYGSVAPAELTYQDLLDTPQNKPISSKWKHYSGLFVLLKQQLRIPPELLCLLQQPVSQALATLVLGNVRSFV